MGDDGVVFPAEELAGAAHTCLHLVTYHHQVLLIAPLAHSLHKLLRARPDTSLTLYRLEQHANGLLACCLFQCFKVIVWHLFEAVGQRYPCSLVGRLACGSSRGQGTPVETVLHADNFISPVAMNTSILACQLDCALVGLSPTIGEE